MAWLEAKSNGLVNVVVVINHPIHVPSLWDYLGTKEVDSTESFDEGERQLKKLGWQEPDSSKHSAHGRSALSQWSIQNPS